MKLTINTVFALKNTHGKSFYADRAWKMYRTVLILFFSLLSTTTSLALPYIKEMSLINRIHKRALRTIYNNSNLELDELLLMDNSCNIHTKHLRTLMVEI